MIERHVYSSLKEPAVNKWFNLYLSYLKKKKFGPWESLRCEYIKEAGIAIVGHRFEIGSEITLATDGVKWWCLVKCFTTVGNILRYGNKTPGEFMMEITEEDAKFFMHTYGGKKIMKRYNALPK